MNILISNDDGINAEGIKILAEEISKIANTYVVAPDSPRSASGHAITLHKPILINDEFIAENVEAYSTSGTPADCVKVGIESILKDIEIDFGVIDENGNIKMVGTNIFTVNKIISDIPVYMQEEFEREENSTFKIPIGSFLGSKLFSGRGPKVNIKMQIVGDLDTDLRSEFTSAGINQTLHRIYLEIKCNVVILTPFETIEQKISNQVLLAEGVIVGEIPNSYYNLEGISKDNAIDIIE